MNRIPKDKSLMPEKTFNKRIGTKIPFNVILLFSPSFLLLLFFYYYASILQLPGLLQD